MVQQLDEWLETLPLNGDYPCISEARRFQHDEFNYDVQYENKPEDIDVGRGAVGFSREYGVDTDGPALEIGCGTGLLSLGLVNENVFPAVLLTDPSPAFLNITRCKLKHAGVNSYTARYALLQGEDTDRLPENTFSLIAL